MNTINEAMRKQFHTLDAEVKAAEAALKKLEPELDAIAKQEAELRAKRQTLSEKKAAIVSDMKMVDNAKERSRIAVYLNGKTGPAT